MKLVMTKKGPIQLLGEIGGATFLLVGSVGKGLFKRVGGTYGDFMAKDVDISIMMDLNSN